MPTRGRAPDCLVDASVAVALLVADHEHHGSTFRVLGGRLLGLAGHAAFETFSVLTRLPAPARRTPAVVTRMLGANFPESRYLSAEGTAALLGRLTGENVAGGAVYDALVGAASRNTASSSPREIAAPWTRTGPSASRSSCSPTVSLAN